MEGEKARITSQGAISWIETFVVMSTVLSVPIAIMDVVLVGLGPGGGTPGLADVFTEIGLIALVTGLAAWMSGLPLWWVSRHVHVRGPGRLCAFSCVAVPTALAVAGAALVLHGAFPTITDRHLRAFLVLASGLAAGGGVGIVAWGGWLAAARVLSRPEPLRRVLDLVAAVVVALSLIAFLVAAGVEFQGKLPVGAALPPALALVLVLIAGAAVAARRGLSVLGGWSRPTAYLAPLFAFVVAQASSSLDTDGGAYLASRNGLGPYLLVHARRVLDLDGDGASWLLAGGDCDDFDSTRGPGAVDIPGNGVDEDCDGKDSTGEIVDDDTGPGSHYVMERGAGPLNVVIACIDATRADHVSFLGYGRRTTPNLDRLAGTSWIFQDAIAPSSTTRESVPGLLSGLYPSGIEWIKQGIVYQLDRSVELLQSVLGRHGYATIAVVDEWLDRFLPSFKRGFDTFVVPYGAGKWLKHGQYSAPYTTFGAIDLLSRRTDTSRPFFLYMHYEAPHFPYVHHEEVPNFGERPVDIYDEEIAYADHYLGIFLDYLRHTGLMDETIVVVFGDHGEEFGEHGGKEHSRQVHVESVHVALLVRVPKRGRAVVRERVSLVDVFPTVLDLLGLQSEAPGVQGYSLLRYVGPHASPPRRRPIFAELMVNNEAAPRYRKAVYLGDYKLMWDMTSGSTVLYDVAADPRETSPIRMPGVKNELMAVLRAHVMRGNHRP